MHYPLNHRDASTSSSITAGEQAALLVDAEAMQAAVAAGDVDALLRGKKFGLLCESFDDADAVLFRLAAAQLGAHVAHIRTSLSELSTPHEVRRTARMLGRLYDAVECQGMAAALVRQVGVEAGVPVYDGVATADHPTARLGDLMTGVASAAERRRFVLQAVLLDTTA